MAANLLGHGTIELSDPLIMVPRGVTLNLFTNLGAALALPVKRG